MNEHLLGREQAALANLFSIIPQAIFQQEEKYCHFLSTFEQENGHIDHVIIWRCKNRSDDIISRQS